MSRQKSIFYLRFNLPVFLESVYVWPLGGAVTPDINVAHLISLFLDFLKIFLFLFLLMDVHHLLSFRFSVFEPCQPKSGGDKGLGVVLPIILCTRVTSSVPQMALVPRRLVRSVLQLGLPASSFQNTSNMPHPKFCQSRRELRFNLAQKPRASCYSGRGRRGHVDRGGGGGGESP